jgi:hypothetical protein
MAGSAEEVLQQAVFYIGKPYRLGASGPTYFDCAGLVYRVFQDTGNGKLVTAHNVPNQAAEFRSRGKEDLNPASARDGDLITFGAYEHIGLYGHGGVISALVSGVSLTEINALLDGNGKPMPVHSVLHTDLSAVPSSADNGPLGLTGLQRKLPGEIGDSAAAAAAAVLGNFGWVPTVAVNGAVLVVVLYLAVGGIRQVVDAAG